jgi:hypothetical protein
MVRLEGDMSLKYPVTPTGIDPGAVLLVAQSLNHYATPGPTINWYVLTLTVHTVDGWMMINQKWCGNVRELI